MNLISLDGVSKSLGEGLLFSEASFGIDEGDRIGFVGPNGCGKSSLLRILSASLEPDSGFIARRQGLSVSLLEQRPSFVEGDTIGDFLYGGDSDLARLARRHRSAQGSDAGEGGGGAIRIERLAEAMEARGGFALEREYASLCTELGLGELSAPMSSLSGGMVKKAALARALAPRADLLLLDEPTNHLDIVAIEWLEERLGRASFAFVLVTHDRWFLDAVCGSILEIDRRELRKYQGGYSDYLRRRLERLSALEKAESRRLAILKGELAWLNRGARARAGKSERRKEAIRSMQSRAPEREGEISSFAAVGRRLGKKVLELHGVSKSYSGRTVLPPITRSYKAGEKLGLVGPNGSGKTTFLDLVAGRLEPDRGRIVRGVNTSIAYFDQRSSHMDMSRSVAEHMLDKGERISLPDGTSQSSEQFLERFGFPRSTQGTPLHRLSGGELRRLQLVRLLADSPNFLLMDEPTNDLDIETIELLEDFLADFRGCAILVSHDRAFLDRTADSILYLDGRGGAVETVGGYRAYAAARSQAIQRGAGGQKAAREAPGGAAGRRGGTGQARLSWAERREYERILEEISALERERGDLEALFASPEATRLHEEGRRYAELDDLIEARIARWEELASRAGDGP